LLGLPMHAYALLGLALNKWQAAFVYSLTNKYSLFLFLFLFLYDERTTHQLGDQIKSDRILSMLSRHAEVQSASSLATLAAS
jgi:hypothetical protein